MKQVSTIDLDPAKTVFQVHGLRGGDGSADAAAPSGPAAGDAPAVPAAASDPAR